MSEIRMGMRYRVALDAPLVTQKALTVLQQGDAGANVIIAEAYSYGEPADLTGCTVEAVMLKENGQRIAMDGAVQGNEAEVRIDDACYTEPGSYVLSIRLKSGTIKRTILRISGQITEEGGNWDD